MRPPKRSVRAWRPALEVGQPLAGEGDGLVAVRAAPQLGVGPVAAGALDHGGGPHDEVAVLAGHLGALDLQVAARAGAGRRRRPPSARRARRRGGRAPAPGSGPPPAAAYRRPTRPAAGAGRLEAEAELRLGARPGGLHRREPGGGLPARPPCRSPPPDRCSAPAGRAQPGEHGGAGGAHAQAGQPDPQLGLLVDRGRLDDGGGPGQRARRQLARSALVAQQVGARVRRRRAGAGAGPRPARRPSRGCGRGAAGPCSGRKRAARCPARTSSPPLPGRRPGRRQPAADPSGPATTGRRPARRPPAAPACARGRFLAFESGLRSRPPRPDQLSTPGRLPPTYWPR